MQIADYIAIGTPHALGRAPWHCIKQRRADIKLLRPRWNSTAALWIQWIIRTC